MTALPRAPNFVVRVVTAAVAIPLVVIPVVAGGFWFALLVLVVTTLATWELVLLGRRAGFGIDDAALKDAPGTMLNGPPFRAASFRALPMVALLAAWSFPLGAALEAPEVGMGLLALATVGGLLAIAARPAPGQLALWGGSLAFGVYVGALIAPAISLRAHTAGLWWVGLILVGTWVCDTAAFVVGRRWGTHRLAAVSPSKTVEGLLAGLAGAVLVALLSVPLFDQPVVRLLGLGVLIGIAAALGDLAESAIKRQLHAKDSGWLLPGHGGMLDRIDSLLFTTFLGYWYVTLTEG